MIDVTFRCGSTALNQYLSTYKVRREQSWNKVITTLGGKEAAAGARYRTVVTVTFVPMTSAQIATVYNLLKSAQIGTYTFTDTHTNTDVTDTMRLVTNLEEAFALNSVDGNRYYKGGPIILRQVQAV